jgi:hypothetical protein
MPRAAALGYAEKVRPQLLSLRQTDLARQTKLSVQAKNTAILQVFSFGRIRPTRLVALHQCWRMLFSPQSLYHRLWYGF